MEGTIVLKRQNTDAGEDHFVCIDLDQPGFIRENLEAVDDIHMRIGITLGIIDKVMKTRFDRELERAGLTVSQMEVLIYILKEQKKQDREITARELEQRFRVSNPTMSGILRRLEKKGFIGRMPGSQDKRNKQIRIKENIDELYQLIQSRINVEKERLFREFTREELAELARLSAKLLHNLEQDGKEE